MFRLKSRSRIFQRWSGTCPMKSSQLFATWILITAMIDDGHQIDLAAQMRDWGNTEIVYADLEMSFSYSRQDYRYLKKHVCVKLELYIICHMIERSVLGQPNRFRIVYYPQHSTNLAIQRRPDLLDANSRHYLEYLRVVLDPPIFPSLAAPQHLH
ncbi:hypothetical protein EJ08DRAFT_427278 [Tothia fuscella]|uniref:Uncharacterized protein n=1 Tax=Tothia fuscella TaxID=1048955 RepID=A0A9P4P0P7_9PEZI|nr:hypothetical protein EJ08DRAFT_427278 [Tothia fuscella]